MDLLIKNATVIDPNSPFNNSKIDILIQEGKIAEIGKIKSSASQIIEHENLYVSPGFTDVNANFCDPGNEHKETLKNGMLAAAKGGYTAVVLSPSSSPTTYNKAGIEYILSQSAHKGIDVFPMGNISVKGEGKDLSEMFDMQQSGAIAFSDAKIPINNNELIKLALLYNKRLNSVMVLTSEDSQLANNGIVNEGIASAGLGLKTRSAIAEEVALAKNLALGEYTNARLHLANISTEKSVERIKQGKKDKLNISADTPLLNLIFNDSEMENFNSNLKVLPPLRTEEDRKALINGIKKGVIDFITSNHEPQNIESKKCELDHAEFGASTIEVTFAALNTYLAKELGLNTIVEKISIAPRKAFNLPISSIQVGENANLTLFNPEISWEVKENSLQSLSKNNPFIGKTLKGKVLGVFNQGKYLANIA